MSTTGTEQVGTASTTTTTPRPHLYLILDDWESGYTFRMVVLLSNNAGWQVPEGGVVPGGIPRETATSLPRPFFRLNADRGWPNHFTAIGSKILAMAPAPPTRKEEDDLDRGGACLDVRVRGLTFVPRHADEYQPIYFHAGSNLFALGTSFFQCLDVRLLEEEGHHHRRRRRLLWRDLPKPPFDSSLAFAHAVHPDEQTIFVSVGFVGPDATYSFRMTEAGESSGWKHVGDWMLPFKGRACFDPDLNTWIGISKHGAQRGRIFSCQLEPAAAGHRPDNVKYGHECLFSRNAGEAHIGATLVRVGRRSKYCLVESVSIEYVKREEDYMFHQERPYFRYMFRVTKFSLEYDENGDVTAGGSQRVRYYFAPKGHQVTSFACEHPVAFSM